MLAQVLEAFGEPTVLLVDRVGGDEDIPQVHPLLRRQGNAEEPRASSTDGGISQQTSTGEFKQHGHGRQWRCGRHDIAPWIGCVLQCRMLGPDGAHPVLQRHLDRTLTFCECFL